MSGFINDPNASTLGGGIPGFQPKLLGGGANANGGSGMVGGGERGLDRMVLRQAFGNARLAGTTGPITNTGAIISPFRAAMNAGDTQGTVNEGPNPALPQINQVNNIRLAANTSANGGAVKTGTAAFSGNPTYVYDGSDYTRFKKLQAKNRTYNDSSFGGSNNGSYNALMRVRH